MSGRRGRSRLRARLRPSATMNPLTIDIGGPSASELAAGGPAAALTHIAARIRHFPWPLMRMSL